MSDAESKDSGGVGAAAARIAGSAVALVGARLELASVEWSEERERIHARLGLLLAGVLLVAIGILAFAAFIVIYFWDTHRLAAVLIPAVVCSVSGLVLVERARASGRNGELPFAATLAEFEKDRIALRGRADDSADTSESST